MQELGKYYNFKREKYFWGLISGIWFILSLLMSAQIIMASGRGAGHLPWYKPFLMESIYCFIWALSAPVCLYYAEKFFFTTRKAAGILIVHIVTGLLLAALTMLIRTVLHWILIDKMASSLNPIRLFQSLYSFLDYGIMSYMLNLLVSYSYFYYNRFRERELQATMLRTELVQAQLQTLKMQIHPHFLFNTLNAITVLIRKNENNSAIKMISDLGNLLRYSMNSINVQEVPLKQELELLKLYLAIEEIRFKDKLTVEFRTEPDTLCAKVPNLILQPLAENSIKHGISQMSHPGIIIIKSSIRQNKLLIQIIDDGPGIDTSWQILKKKGIGLSNTESRLTKLYGTTCSFELVNNSSGGTTAIIEIPFTVYESDLEMSFSASVSGNERDSHL